MKISDIITAFDEIRPNSFSDDIKISWVKALESDIRSFAALHTEQAANFEFLAEEDPELSLGDENKQMYVYYLSSMADMANAEFRLYSVDSSYFNELFAGWRRKHRSENLPLQKLSLKI